MRRVENHGVIFFPKSGEPVAVSEAPEHKIEETSLGLAREAYNLHKSHEKICDLRWVYQHSQNTAMLAELKAINTKFWHLAVGLIATLLTVSGTLIVVFVLK